MALIPGCEVRVLIGNMEKGGWEAIYFIITKIKNGTHWGITQPRYRFDDYIGLANGETMTFRREHILEIPLRKSWQPRAYVKATKHLPVNERED
ncbi:hypothetical protein Slin14017_G057970 [Septoria linicola]|nr:hypothetical protein Slin14017_G057970 [Septoria linicola]